MCHVLSAVCYELCAMCYVLCAMCYVLCAMWYVVCAICYVLCAMFYVLCAPKVGELLSILHNTAMLLYVRSCGIFNIFVIVCFIMFFWMYNFDIIAFLWR